MISPEFRNDLYRIGVFILAMWLIRIVDATIPFSLADYGLYPRRLSGLIGIVTMPFLHASFAHLFSNSVSLAILLGLLVGSQKRPWPLVVMTALIGGSLLWLHGRNANHIGASGLVFGVIGLLTVIGFLQKRVVPVIVTMVVAVLFGGTILWGVLPGGDPRLPWDGHLCGLLGGVLTAFWFVRTGLRPKIR